ncbi:carbohydrate ABC transporter permease [Cohnella sp. WQ 127256]|uniref:carbohydrate ABC transporter permease n=1 Tax=Cohnella sp. WQ 127256 TaxID=2938790 RepID=UPI002118818A|nr:sugar ABC transporter permease [Cohnella sp. WQ 127256]
MATSSVQVKNRKQHAIKFKKGTLTYDNFYIYLLMVLPVLILYMVFKIIPSLSSFYFSLTDFNGITTNFTFLGMKNYVNLFQERHFIEAMSNTIYFSILVTVLQNTLGLLAAIGLNQALKSKNILRTVLFSPALINAIVVAYIWSYIFDFNGPLNTVLKKLGFIDEMKTWLGDESFALYGVVIAHVWRFIGYTAVIYLANLQSIPHEVIEASEIDGANSWKRFWRIIFPLLAPSTTINVLLAFSGTMQVFDIIYGLTNGGPGYSTEMMATYIVREITNNQVGYAAAMGIILFFFTLLFNGIVYTFLRKREANYE